MNLLYGSIGTVLVVVIGFLVAQWLPLKWTRVNESPVVYVVYGAIYLMATALACYFIANLFAPVADSSRSVPVSFESFVMFVMKEAMWIYSAAFSTSAAFLLALNQWIFKESSRRTWLASKMAHNKLDRLCIKALEDTLLLCLVLETGKVYVGWVVEVPLPNDDREYVNILPMQSGYKDENHQFVFNVFHDQILKEHGPLAAGYLASPKTILRSSIQTANVFDSAVYELFDLQYAEIAAAHAKAGPRRG